MSGETSKPVPRSTQDQPACNGYCYLCVNWSKDQSLFVTSTDTLCIIDQIYMDPNQKSTFIYCKKCKPIHTWLDMLIRTLSHTLINRDRFYIPQNMMFHILQFMLQLLGFICQATLPFKSYSNDSHNQFVIQFITCHDATTVGTTISIGRVDRSESRWT